MILPFKMHHGYTTVSRNDGIQDPRYGKTDFFQHIGYPADRFAFLAVTAVEHFADDATGKITRAHFQKGGRRQLKIVRTKQSGVIGYRPSQVAFMSADFFSILSKMMT